MAENGSLEVTIPAGLWKLAYTDETDRQYFLRDEDELDPVWFKCEFEKDKTYTLLMATDGNRTVWSPSFNLHR